MVQEMLNFDRVSVKKPKSVNRIHFYENLAETVQRNHKTIIIVIALVFRLAESTSLPIIAFRRSKKNETLWLSFDKSIKKHHNP